MKASKKIETGTVLRFVAVILILLLSIAGFIAPALIVWYAWKWPKQEA